MQKEKINMQEISEMSCEEIYSCMLARQIKAIMFHEQMTILFDFLNLHGFKRMHEYQYFCENKEMRGIQRYFINHHNKLIPEKEIENPNLIPADWYKYSRDEVTSTIKKQYIEKCFKDYVDWESETKTYLEAYAKALMNQDKIADFNFINKMICDVDKELKRTMRMYIKLKSVNYDLVYVEEIQPELHKKYKNKMKDTSLKL
jgi:hypothetical protein